MEGRKAFVRDIVKEASKFKRKMLIQQLEDWGAKLTSLKSGSIGSAASSEQKLAGKAKGTQKR